MIDDLNFNETIVDPKDPNNYKLYKNRIEIDLPVIQQDRTFKKEFKKYLAFSNFMILF